MLGRALLVRIGRETVLGFCDTDRQISVTAFLKLFEAIADLLITDDIVRTVDLLRDRLCFLPERHIVRVDRLETGRCRLDRLHDGLSEICCAGAASSPV